MNMFKKGGDCIKYGQGLIGEICLIERQFGMVFMPHIIKHILELTLVAMCLQQSLYRSLQKN
ncbi:hypothetical protein SAMN05428977_10321 [Nitrosomonas sp. Nm166]|nr:hypothetical protein SAMN05428977_10321 [Nitrosomonas sp. Nm166]